MLQKGDTLCLDFGNHWVGHVTLRLSSTGSHPDAPAWLRLKFAERPVELFENAEDYRGWISKGWIQQEQVHIDVLPCELALPRRYAFRYLQIEVLDASSKYCLTLEDVWCEATTSADDGALAPYATGDSGLARLDAVACRTLRECMQSVFEDGPKRDRRLWMGDLRMQALANYETYKNNDLVKACLYLFAGTTMEHDRVGACLFLEPEIEVDDTRMFDYSLFYIAALRDYYKATGDEPTARELLPTAFHQLELAKDSFDERGVVRDSDVLGWCFVDWNLNLNKQAGAQGIYLYCLCAAIELAELLGEQEKAVALRQDYDRKKTAALNFLWDKEKGLFVSGERKQISWASQIWMVLGGAVTGTDAAELLARLEETDGAEAMVTPYMYHNYVDALLSCGEREKALRVLKTYWGGMVEQGADTFWELYNPENPDESPYGGTIVNSFCHAWSCAPAYFLRKFYA
ncbi:MAG: cellobiose phosphorylase [Oscillospiraceae bacterium]|nr:cellobiose phosphorylase [Oscillospiraceae bacterium]